jgi:small-conductance mechanosensitive channel
MVRLNRSQGTICYVTFKNVLFRSRWTRLRISRFVRRRVLRSLLFACKAACCARPGIACTCDILDSVCVLLCQILLANFAKLYGAFLRRLRLYSATRVFFQWFVGVPLLTLPFLIAMIFNYKSDVQSAIESWSIKQPIMIYGLSLVIIVYLFTIGCKLVAECRGTKSTR